MKLASAAALAASCLLAGASPAPAASGSTLVELRPVPEAAAGASLLRSHGATVVSTSLRIWRVPTDDARRLLPVLRRRGLLRASEPEVRYQPHAAYTFSDPLVASEWWRAAVGADAAEPPGPGKPVTVVDNGVDLTHPEFAGRPDTTALDRQEISGARTGFHGTAVSSLVAAPANGVGEVGVYPQAVLQVFDANLSGSLTNAEVIRGIEAAAATGPGVVNLSLGSTEFDPLVRDVIDEAFGKRLIIVAAAGNDGESGSPEEFPASLPHVLTVAATDAHNHPASFSTESLGVDLAAPGEGVPYAVPLAYDPSGYSSGDGTSFASPIVAGATAWVWTARPELDNTQVFDLMRFSARDVGERDFDSETGFGLLDIPAALSAEAPPPDPLEPNEDVDLVAPGGLFAKGKPLLTHPGALAARLRARLDASEDPEDVYRVYVPAHRTLTVTVAGDADLSLAAWGPSTRSVGEHGIALRRDLLAIDEGGRSATVEIENRRASALFAYVDVTLGTYATTAGYMLATKGV
jgi:subtilisin family serine protease